MRFGPGDIGKGRRGRSRRSSSGRSPSEALSPYRIEEALGGDPEEQWRLEAAEDRQGLSEIEQLVRGLSKDINARIGTLASRMSAVEEEIRQLSEELAARGNRRGWSRGRRREPSGSPVDSRKTVDDGLNALVGGQTEPDHAGD